MPTATPRACGSGDTPAPVTACQPASERGLASTARQIIDASRYLTLATADIAGNPWGSPVWYAHADYASFFWVSRPQARHSRNLGVRTTVSFVIFDSTAPERQAQAVYLEALAEELSGTERDQGIAIFSRKSRDLGLREWRTADVTTPAPHRLYRARASACYILAPNDQRLPVKIGGSLSISGYRFSSANSEERFHAGNQSVRNSATARLALAPSAHGGRPPDGSPWHRPALAPAATLSAGATAEKGHPPGAPALSRP